MGLGRKDTQPKYVNLVYKRLLRKIKVKRRNYYKDIY